MLLLSGKYLVGSTKYIQVHGSTKVRDYTSKFVQILFGEKEARLGSQSPMFDYPIQSISFHLSTSRSTKTVQNVSPDSWKWSTHRIRRLCPNVFAQHIMKFWSTSGLASCLNRPPTRMMWEVCTLNSCAIRVGITISHCHLQTKSVKRKNRKEAYFLNWHSLFQYNNKSSREFEWKERVSYLSAAFMKDVHPSTRVLAATTASEVSELESLASFSSSVPPTRGYALKIALTRSEMKRYIQVTF